MAEGDARRREEAIDEMTDEEAEAALLAKLESMPEENG